MKLRNLWYVYEPFVFSRFIHMEPVSVLHSFLLLNNILPYGCTTFCLFIHWLMDIWIVFNFWFYEEYCQEHSYTSFCVDICFHFFWAYIQEWNFELLGHMVTLPLIPRGTARLFPKQLHILHFHQSCMRTSISPHSWQYLHYLFFIIAILVGMKCISLWLDLYFFDGYWCWAFSHVFIEYLYNFFGERSTQIFCPFWNYTFFIKL